MMLARKIIFGIGLSLMITLSATAETEQPATQPTATQPSAVKVTGITEKSAEQIQLQIEELIANPPTFVTANSPPPTEPRKDCKSTQEFIDTLSWLRNSETYKFDEGHNQKVAFEVARGCTGASKRFVKSLEYLDHYKIGGKNTFRLAVQLAKANDHFAEVFLNVLAVSFHPKKLNLDVLNSIRAAYSLSLGYKGNPKKAQEDFLGIAKFCNEDPSVQLSLPRCAQLAIDIAKFGENFEKPLAPVFADMVKYMLANGITIYESILITTDVIKIGPDATENFKTAFQYASKKDGMDLDRRGAMQFAMEMSRKTLEGQGTQDYLRLPASLENTPTPKAPAKKRE